MISTFRKMLIANIFNLTVCGAAIALILIGKMDSSPSGYIIISCISYSSYRVWRSWSLLKEHSELGEKRFYDEHVRSLAYEGLAYIAGRDGRVDKAEVEKIKDLMRTRFGTEPMSSMVHKAIEHAIASKAEHRSVIHHLDPVVKSLRPESIKDLKTLYYEFAYDKNARTPLGEQAYHELVAVLDGYGTAVRPNL